jgi:hypothetical protein
MYVVVVQVRNFRKVTKDISQATKRFIFVLPNFKFKEFVMLKIQTMQYLI